MPLTSSNMRHIQASLRPRLSAPLGHKLLACTTNHVHPGCTLAKTPLMAKVQHGTEPMLNGQPMWDCTDTPAKCFSSLLDGMGTEMLARCSLQGKLGPRSRVARGLVHFKQSQTSGNKDNLEDQTSHMPACTSFLKGSPFTKHERVTDTYKTWYTWVRLGKDKDGDVVREHAHVLIAAARFGVPDSWLQQEPKVEKKDKLIACHCPCCPGVKGGCCNPLHIRWGTHAQNKHDQCMKKKLKVQGVHVGRVTSPCKPPSVVVVLPMRVTRSQAVKPP